MPGTSWDALHAYFRESHLPVNITVYGFLENLHILINQTTELILIILMDFIFTYLTTSFFEQSTLGRTKRAICIRLKQFQEP